ncbi:hypothetical protein [Rhodoblastus sp.]|uniref:hypothetical protein n=1 Tax=Rhodoblastus sp. TaxID=1962975 RepID=UPI003F9A370A
MKPDSKIDCSRAPVVALGGQEFFVPTLALRQARVVVPGLLKLMPRLNAIQARIAAGDPLGATLLDKDDVELMIDVVHCGLTRAYPDLSRDDLLDLEAAFPELIAALGAIAKQTGLFTAADGQTPGE